MKLSVFLAVLLGTIISCKSSENGFNPKVFLINPVKSELYRKDVRLSCGDIKASNYVCFDDHEFKRIHNQCVQSNLWFWEKW